MVIFHSFLYVYQWVDDFHLYVPSLITGIARACLPHHLDAAAKQNALPARGARGSLKKRSATSDDDDDDDGGDDDDDYCYDHGVCCVLLFLLYNIILSYPFLFFKIYIYVF